MAGLVGGDAGLLLQHDDPPAWVAAGELVGGRQADDPAADHRQVE